MMLKCKHWRRMAGEELIDVQGMATEGWQRLSVSTCQQVGRLAVEKAGMM